MEAPFSHTLAFYPANSVYSATAAASLPALRSINPDSTQQEVSSSNKVGIDMENFFKAYEDSLRVMKK